MTISDAAHEWVREFNAVPQQMIAKLMQANAEEWEEVTVPTVGDRVYVYELPDGCNKHEGEIARWDKHSGIYTVRLDDGSKTEVNCDAFEIVRYDALPMWGTMWSFGDPCDIWWVENGAGIEALSSCGFLVYRHDDFGIFFGINGAGYDFYESHWIPLYRARGLEWHDPATEKAARCG